MPRARRADDGLRASQPPPVHPLTQTSLCNALSFHWSRTALYPFATPRERLSVDDAVFALALQRYVFVRARWGEQLTQVAILHVISLARRMGLTPKAQVEAIGFQVVGTVIRPMHRDSLIAAIRLVRTHERVTVVYSLYAQFGHLTVNQLESLSQSTEPGQPR